MGDGATGNSLKAERDRFVAFSFAGADLLIELEADGRVRYVSGAVQGLLGRPAAAVMGQPLTSLIVPERAPVVDRALKALAIGDRLPPTTFRFRLPAGQGPQMVLTGCRLPNYGGAYHLTAALARGGAFNRATAERDPESGLFERESFARAATKVLRAGRAAGADYRLTLLDLGELEGFRQRVDGDVAASVAGEVAAYLQAVSVGGDTAGQMTADRYGIVHRAEVSARDIEQSVARIVRQSDPSGRGIAAKAVSLDIGAGELSDGDAARALVYAINTFAESAGQDFTLSSLADGLAKVVADTTAKVAAFRQTVLPANFSLAFQPVVDLATRTPQHFEALSRFADGAATFKMINFAEQVGMVEDFDLMVVRRALEFLEEEKAAGRQPIIAVNLSGRSLQSAVFGRSLLALLEPSKRNAFQLMVEVTESAAIDRMPEVDALLQQLRGRGHKVCLDDFGAGSAAFHYLRGLTVDYVKIDGSYVRDIVESARDRSFVQAIAGLCRSLSVRCVAEMVETEAQAAALKAAGVQYGQGYLFGRPAPSLVPGGRR